MMHRSRGWLPRRVVILPAAAFPLRQGWLQWACAAALLGIGASSGSAKPMVPMVTVASPLPWLQITPPSDPRFTALVSSAVPPNVPGMIAAVLPYSVVVTHNGQQALIGLDVRFTVRLPDRTVYRNYFYNSFSQPQRPLMPPGRVMVFTPLASANALAGGAAPGAAGSGGPMSSPTDQSAIQMLSSANEINVSIDLAIAQNGLTAGPDVSQIVAELTQQNGAYTDMSGECLARLAAGTPDAAIQAWLLPLSKQNLYRNDATGRVDGYSSAQAKLATQWLAYLSAGRRSDLATILSVPPPQLAIVASLKGGLQ